MLNLKGNNDNIEYAHHYSISKIILNSCQKQRKMRFLKKIAYNTNLRLDKNLWAMTMKTSGSS